MSTLTSTDGTRIVFSWIGAPAPDPAVFVPGGPARGVEYLADLARDDESRAVAVLHPRGTPTTGSLSRGWWTDADDLIALLDRLGLASADIVAHSAGTRLALAAAARYPHRVRSLTLITPSASWFTTVEHDGAAIARARGDGVIDAAVLALRAETAAGQVAFDRRRAASDPAGYAHWGARERAHATAGAWAWDAAAAWFRDVPADAADRIRAAVPARVTVISGRDDILSGREPVRAYAAALNARLDEIEGCGHYPWVEQPAAFRHALSTALA